MDSKVELTSAIENKRAKSFALAIKQILNVIFGQTDFRITLYKIEGVFPKKIRNRQTISPVLT